MTTRDDILTAALKLDADDRERLAMELVASLPDDDPEQADPETGWPAWQVRIVEERMAALDAGEMKTYPADEAFAWIHAKLEELRTNKATG